MRLVVAVALLLLASAMAGCAQNGGDGAKDPGTLGGSTSGTGTGPGNGTGSTAYSVTLKANQVNGTAPLSVEFTINATVGAASWRLSFGDGAIGNGTGQPSVANHTYPIGGNFSANLTVAYPSGNLSSSLAIAVAVPEGGGPPEVTHFEFADSLGCLGEDGPGADQCISFQGGPDSSGIDGYWQALDLRYWGLSFTSTVTQGGPVGPALNDSDCAFTDEAFAIIGFASNSSNPCAGSVPEGTAWIFIFPFATPALEMAIDFTA